MDLGLVGRTPTASERTRKGLRTDRIIGEVVLGAIGNMFSEKRIAGNSPDARAIGMLTSPWPLWEMYMGHHQL